MPGGARLAVIRPETPVRNARGKLRRSGCGGCRACDGDDEAEEASQVTAAAVVGRRDHGASRVWDGRSMSGARELRCSIAYDQQGSKGPLHLNLLASPSSVTPTWSSDGPKASRNHREFPGIARGSNAECEAGLLQRHNGWMGVG